MDSMFLNPTIRTQNNADQIEIKLSGAKFSIQSTKIEYVRLFSFLFPALSPSLFDLSRETLLMSIDI